MSWSLLLFMLLLGGIVVYLVHITPSPKYAARGKEANGSEPASGRDALHVRGYRKRASVLNGSERAFFYELTRQMPDGYYVFPNMRIADMLQAVDGAGFYQRRNKILPKHVDFLVCDANFRPVFALEVNGSSHGRPDRIERDQQVRQIFADAGLPLEFVNVGADFSSRIAEIIASLKAS